LAVGVGIGVLFAPRAGKETREMILNATCDCVQSGIAEGKEQISEIISKKKEEFCSTTDEKSEGTSV
jgi:gas vesicle protein